MKLEVGKSYKRADGIRADVLAIDGDEAFVRVHHERCGARCHVYRFDGEPYSATGIVEEWRDKPRELWVNQFVSRWGQPWPDQASALCDGKLNAVEQAVHFREVVERKPHHWGNQSRPTGKWFFFDDEWVAKAQNIAEPGRFARVAVPFYEE